MWTDYSSRIILNKFCNLSSRVEVAKKLLEYYSTTTLNIGLPLIHISIFLSCLVALYHKTSFEHSRPVKMNVSLNSFKKLIDERNAQDVDSVLRINRVTWLVCTVINYCTLPSSARKNKKQQQRIYKNTKNNSSFFVLKIFSSGLFVSYWKLMK